MGGAQDPWLATKAFALFGLFLAASFLSGDYGPLARVLGRADLVVEVLRALVALALSLTTGWLVDHLRSGRDTDGLRRS